MLENDVAEMGGEAVILETIALDRAQEEKVVARFKSDRDEQYREFIGCCADFEAEIARRALSLDQAVPIILIVHHLFPSIPSRRRW